MVFPFHVVGALVLEGFSERRHGYTGQPEGGISNSRSGMIKETNTNSVHHMLCMPCQDETEVGG